MKIDPYLNNIGYRLGRLFSVLEKIETEAAPGVESTLRCLHYGIAVSRPVTIFPDLIKAAKEQLPKIQNAELRDKLSPLLAYIMEDLHAIPNLLNAPDQTMFMQAYEKQNLNFREGIYE
jgi:CRISPR-associated protein Csd1